MKERQRWQPEEDALLRAYVHQYGPKEWHLISRRLSKPFNRDPKSCLERWKNYLKPDVKKGSLTPEEQSLVISLQAKYGNKWKKIAAEVPGRTAKRLGKWWEVFKEKQHKQQLQKNKNTAPPPSAGGGSPGKAIHGEYDHILETFAEKYVQPYFRPPVAMPNLNSPILSLGSGSFPPGSNPSGPLPPWMNTRNGNNPTSTTPSPSVSLTLSPSESVVLDPVHSDHPIQPRFFPVQLMGTVAQCCKEAEEAKENWVQHKKEAAWRLSRVEQQLEAEKGRKRKEKMQEFEAKIRCLREEETAALRRMEGEYREKLSELRRDAEGKEVKLMEAWSNKQMKLSKLVEEINGGLSKSQRMISVANYHHGCGV